MLKLDGVGPVDNRPSTDKLHHCVRKKTQKKPWHATRLGGWTFAQNISSLALTVCDLWYYEDLEKKDDLITESIN